MMHFNDDVKLFEASVAAYEKALWLNLNRFRLVS